MALNDKDFGLDIGCSDTRNFNAAGSRTGYRPIQYRFREYLAEFLGTCVLLLFGNGVCAQVTFNDAAKGSSYLSINFGWAFAVMLGIYVSGPISGAHINPAVTIANAIHGKFPWKKVPGFALAQFLGAFVGAALVYLMYWPAFDQFDGGVRQTTGKMATAGIFATYPYATSPIWNCFLTEIINTCFMMICICGINDPRHKIPSWMGAVAVGLLIGAIGISIGMMTGYAMNPARDFGPRFFTLVAGWGTEPFTAAGYYFWNPIIAPIVGATLGIFLYDIFVLPAELDDQDQ